MNSYKQNPKTEEKDLKNGLVPKNKVLTRELSSNCSPLNQNISFFITNPSMDYSQGSSLYFISRRGTIRCRSDHISKQPIISINPFIVRYSGYQKRDGEFVHEKVEPAVGLAPSEGDLNWVNHEEGTRATHHKGHAITEIISLEQFNNPKFMPKTWVNREEVGLLWSSAVDQIKEAEESARLNLNSRGHYIPKEISIPYQKKPTTIPGDKNLLQNRFFLGEKKEVPNDPDYLLFKTRLSQMQKTIYILSSTKRRKQSEIAFLKKVIKEYEDEEGKISISKCIAKVIQNAEMRYVYSALTKDLTIFEAIRHKVGKTKGLS